ncbi:MAG: family 16 glycosylhydrolase [Cytophaga sp.]|uniref:family 16 glycosylhydrolase n=1 Tax=Cytophaga sp. TaxID=29535 RepID=UPI003F7E1B53
MQRFILLGICTWLSYASFAQEKPYLGAEIRTIETFQYGRFEARMKPSEASGMIYSFFTFYDEPDFASNWNEIDVEVLGRYSNEVQFNAITGNHQMFEKRYVLPFNPHEDFHNYAFTWTPSYIAWSVDGVEVYRQTGAHIAKMNRPQKLMMNVWPSRSAGWAGPIDAAKIPLQAQYDFVKYYSYQSNPKDQDTFKLKWTDNFDKIDYGRWQLATHTFDTNECVFTPDNAVVEEGILKLKLTKPVDEEVVVIPTQFIESATCVANTSKKYEMYIPVKVKFYAPVNRMYCKPEFFTVSEGIVKHVYLDMDLMYVILYVDGLDIRKIKTQKVLYKPTVPGSEKFIQDVAIK